MEDESVLISASGKPYVRANGISIHSSYQPDREASNFLLNSTLGKNPGVVVLLGAGLNYISAFIRENIPAVRIISIQYSSFYRGRERDSPNSAFYGGSPEELRKFLETAIDESDMGSIAILEWPPSALAYPEAARTAMEELAARIRILNGSVATTQAFGKRWIRNCLRNLLAAREFSIPRPLRLPVFVAASGPSLNDAIPFLRRERDSYFLIALSSSLDALAAGRIQADLVLATDPGEWAGFHLAALARGAALGSPAIPAYPLTACSRSFVPRSGPPLLLDGRSPAERDIIKAFSIPALPCPASGTVADSALRLALALSPSRIIAFGLDLCANPSRSHASPSAFETMLRAVSSRSKPYDFANWEEVILQNPLRTKWGRSSVQLETYASGLSILGRENPGRIGRFLPSAVKLTGFCPVTEGEIRSGFANGRKTFPGFGKFTLPGLRERREILGALSRHWKNSALEAAEREGRGEEKDRQEDSILSFISYSRLLKLRKAGRSGASATAKAAEEELKEQIRSFFSDLEKRYLE